MRWHSQSQGTTWLTGREGRAGGSGGATAPRGSKSEVRPTVQPVSGTCTRVFPSIHSVKAGSRRWADVAIEKKLRAKELSAGSPAPCRNAHQTLFLNRTLYLGASFCWGKKMMQKPWILPKDCRLQPGINSPVPRYTTLQQGCRAPLLRMFFGPQQKILTKFCSEDSYCLCILDSSLQDFTC